MTRWPPVGRWLRANGLEVVLVGTTAIALAILTTWPLLPNLNDHAHDAFDPLFQAWTIDWVQHALTSRASVWDANTFLGHHRTLAYSDALIGAAVALMPFRWLGLSPIGVENVGLLLGYAASAAAGYVFGRVVTRSAVVGACTGVLYGFGSYNSFLGQHMNIVMHPGPALAATATWTLADRCRARRPMWPSLAALAVVATLQGTVSFYTCAMCVVAAGAVLLARVRDLRWRGVGGAVVALGAAMLALLPLAWPYLSNTRQMDDTFKWPLRDLAVSGADFTAVDPSLRIWGGRLGAATGIFGQPTFPGVSVIVLAIVGLLLWRSGPVRRTHVVAVSLVVVGFLLAIGTSDRGWRRYTPYRVLYQYVPGGAALRATGRFWLVGLLGVGLLVGLAVRRLADLAAGSGGRRAWAGVAVVVLSLGCVLAEGQRSWSDAPKVAIPTVDLALARLPDGGGVAFLPLPLSADPRFPLLGQAQILYGSTAHHRPLLNGYAGFYPKDFFRVGDQLVDLPGERALDHLRRVGVRYIVVPPDAGVWQPLRDPARAAPLRLLGEYDGDLLYEVPAVGAEG